MNRAVELIKCFYLKDPSGVSFYPYLLIMASSLRWPTVYDQYHHFDFSFVSIILENVDEF